MTLPTAAPLPAVPADPYRWLEDPAGPRTRAWEEAHETAFRQAADGWRLRRALAGRLTALTAQPGAVSAPRPFGDLLFHTRLAPHAEHPRLVVTDPDGTERTLVDPAVLDPAGHTTLEAWEPSWDGTLLAYQIAAGGTEHCELYVLDTRSGALVDGPIDRVRRTSVAWLPGGTGFYYVRRLHPSRHPGEEQYHRRVYLHTVGRPGTEDVLIFGAGRERTQHYTVRTSPDGRWLVLSAAAGTSPARDVWLADLAASGPARPRFRTVQEGVDARTSAYVGPGAAPEGSCLVFTELGAGRGRLARTTPADPAPATWRDVLPADPEAVLEDFALLDAGTGAGPVLLASWTRHAVGELTVHDPADGRLLRALSLPPCSSVGPLRTGVSRPAEAWFTLGGFTAPARVHHFDARTGEVTPWQAPDPGPRPAAVRTRQLVFRSYDGTAVRMFVIAPDDDGPRRPRPAILTGYGGFGQSLTPCHSPEAVAWAEAGGVYAIACVRGGGEEGDQWHRAGMREHKQNTFDDLDAAAGHLLAEGWTTRGQLGVWGASNGGLLAGAALTQHPGTYAAAACVAPLLDMARYELSGLGPTWAGEYGTAADPEQLRWLLSYSPYHHVEPGARYPAVLFTVFDGDSRVDPLHARKMCAALEAATGSGQPVLYRLERGVGHGARSTSSRVALLADLLAFFADRLGLDGAPPASEAGRQR